MSERRSLNEIVSLYALEPSLSFILVEGELDVCLLKWISDELEAKKLSILPVEAVNVPNDLLDKYSIPDGGHRGRVLAASKFFEDEKSNPLQVACIVDKDFDEIFDKNPENSILVTTDYSCWEMYCYNEKTIKKFLGVGCGIADPNVNQIMQLINIILVDLSLIRISNQALNWNMQFVDLKKYIDYSSGQLVFDLRSYLLAYLQRNSRTKQSDEFHEVFSHFRAKLPSDIRAFANGHDLTTIICRMLAKMLNRPSLSDEKIVDGLLKSSLDIEDVVKEELFNRLENRLISFRKS